CRNEDESCGGSEKCCFIFDISDRIYCDRTSWLGSGVCRKHVSNGNVCTQDSECEDGSRCMSDVCKETLESLLKKLNPS
ncbi:hypothetical protein Ciccas_009442, partial [Cichlidogyrus casuarinus]